MSLFVATEPTERTIRLREPIRGSGQTFRTERPEPAAPRAATFPDEAASSTLVSEEGSASGSRLR
jgi:hypothetical protein